MIFDFLPAAQREFEEAVNYYDRHGFDLGDEFSREIYETIQRILANPETWPRAPRNTRKCLVHRFPFAVIYRVHPERVLIVAVAHHSREPGYWKRRLAESE